MRSSGVMLWLVLAVPAVGAEFPYTAYVTARDVYVRSGPGRNFYPTDKLQFGQKVEVYRHDPGGWYAIRPPQGSFTWVSARDVRPLEDGLGRVSGEQVSARVGSRFSNVRDVVQVRLHQDELVEILEDYNDSGQMWYKIAPPSGEFRWVSQTYVDRQEPNDGGSWERRRTGRLRSLIDPVDDDIHSTSFHESADQSRPTWLRRTEDRSPVRRRTSSGGEPAEMLDVLDEELSLMVAEEPTAWQFDQLRTEVETLIGQVETAVDRDRLRRLLGKIDRFDDILRRYQQVNNVQITTDRLNQPLVAAAQRRQSAPALWPSASSSPQRAASPAADGSGYDGIGVLRPVISRRHDAPRFALVDQTGVVLSFVTPARGVILDKLIGRKIGITGTRGYMPEYHQPHLVAQHVALLDGPAYQPSPPTFTSANRGRY